ncbi:Structural maintenance of chromosomes protein 4 [Chamberlinius hualienensis]
MRTPSKHRQSSANDVSVSFTGNLEEDDNEEFIEIGGIKIPPPPPPSLTFDPTGPRLFIHKIVIENFKSYGGRTTLGPFHKNFAAVIGPNGSGKSNVIDAMLFVFGYRAQKIRSKTVGVLIHNSDAFPNCNSCTVAVHFEKIVDRGRDEYDLVPDSQFVVSRVANKDNSSYYTINNRRVQFKEVSKLLRSHGIDLDHNRFLILQGEVEQISLMKPIAPNPHETGMLEFLEDLIGTGRLKEPIGQLQTRVDELNERRTEKLSRVKTAEADKNELEGLKNDALDYIKLKNEVAIKKHLHTQIMIHERHRKVAVAEKELEQLQQSNSDFITEYKALEENIKDCEDNLTQANKMYNDIKKKCEENRVKFTQLELEDVSTREDFKHTKEKLKKCQLSLKKEQSKAEELSGAPDKLTKDIEELQEAKNEVLEKKKEAEANLTEVTSSLKSETAEIQAEKEKQEKILFDEQTAVNNFKSKVDIAFSELDLYTKEEDTEKAKWESMTLNLELVETNLDNRKTDLKTVNEILPKLEMQLAANKIDLAKVVEAEPQVSEKFRQLRNKLEDCRNQMQNQSSRNRLLNSLMKEKAEGRLPGIIGRLGDLGGIDAKYDVAVSTACPQLDNIITDTLDTAIKCVNFLKQNNLGQATFIGLDKMAEWKQFVGKNIETPLNVPRLFDLINVKDKHLLPAFYFVMRDTLVANNIESATQIGLRGAKRYRVVTLKGELVELSGTMSGGGSRPMKGRMGTSAVQDTVTSDDLRAMEMELAEAQQERDDALERKSHLETTIGNGEKELELKVHEVKRLTKEIEAMGNQIVVLKPQIKAQEEKYKKAKCDPNKVKELTIELERNQKDFVESERTANKYKAKVQELHEQIMEIGGKKLKSAQKKLTEVNLQLNKLTEEITKKTVAIKSSHKNQKSAEENARKLEAEIVQLEDSLNSLRDKVKEADAAGIALNELKTLCEKEMTECETELKHKQKVLKKLRSGKAEMEEKRLDIRNEMEQAESNVSNVKNELKSWKDKLQKIKQVEMEGIELRPFPTLTLEELNAVDVVEIERSIEDSEHQLGSQKPNLGVIEQYKEKEELYLQRVEEFECITKDRDEMRKCYDELRKRRFDEFMKGFTIISQKLKETYQMLTLGGDADLELVNSLDPFTDGILFSVRPPRKSWKNISNLSGGEKTLSSLSLVFALHYYNPTPFYVMDEIDAALDFRNVAIVAHYIKEQTKNAQFIVVSLRENMFEQANRLVGVYKTHDTSHSVCLDINSFSDPTPAAKHNSSH